MVLEQTRADISARKTLIEAKYSGGVTKRFWVFNFNIIMTLAALIAFGIMFSVVFETATYMVAAIILVVILLYCLEPDKMWSALTEWRKGK